MFSVLSWLLFVSVAKLELRFPDQLAALFVRFGLVDAFVSLPQAVSLAFDASIESFRGMGVQHNTQPVRLAAAGTGQLLHW